MVNKQFTGILVVLVVAGCLAPFVGSAGQIVQISSRSASDSSVGDDFYFVQLTDTHIRYPLFDEIGLWLFEMIPALEPIRGSFHEKVDSLGKFQRVIDYILSFDPQPAFIVVTGDVVDWGSGVDGAQNCQLFVESLYQQDNRLFADSSYLVPVYVVPGNHDYMLTKSLRNYYRVIDPLHSPDDNKFMVCKGNTCLFLLDSGSNYVREPRKMVDVLGNGLTDEDIDWFTDALRRSSADHRIVLMHHPVVNAADKAVIARNREVFVQLCEAYDVELVLTGHTHSNRVYDKNKDRYDEDVLPLNCSRYPPLYVQTDSCATGLAYRNVSVVDGHVWLEPCMVVPN